MYFVNGIPFTFDDVIGIVQDDPYIKIEAENNFWYTTEDMYRYSNYLIMEECHPLLFEMDLENPEEMPCD